MDNSDWSSRSDFQLQIEWRQGESGKGSAMLLSETENVQDACEEHESCLSKPQHESRREWFQ